MHGPGPELLSFFSRWLSTCEPRFQNTQNRVHQKRFSVAQKWSRYGPGRTVEPWKASMSRVHLGKWKDRQDATGSLQ
jgi:hypothetical protein